MGSVEEGKGKLKKAAGDILDNPDLKNEGQAQVDKAKAEQDAQAEKEKAARHEREADNHEHIQRSEQSKKI